MESCKTGVALPAMFEETMRASADDAREAGFDTVSLVWKGTDRTALSRNAAIMRAADLPVSSVHGPFTGVPGNPGGINAMWTPGEAGDEYADLLMDCAEDCAAARIPVMVVHPTFGNAVPRPSELGVERCLRVGEHAAALGVRVAVETMEFAAHLRALTDNLPPETFGICWDAGHAQAYTPEEDWLTEYAGRILAVHLHDNPGKTKAGVPDTRDDTHYLPYDGVRDWAAAMRALARARYRGPLTLEVKRGRSVCPQRPEYAAFGQRAFFAEAHRRALRLAQEFSRAAGKETVPGGNSAAAPPSNASAEQD